ncbi:hypothetical protein CapIbe_019816 [Capra ibex]
MPVRRPASSSRVFLAPPGVRGLCSPGSGCPRSRVRCSRLPPTSLVDEAKELQNIYQPWPMCLGNSPANEFLFLLTSGEERGTPP